jgi:hypothetical protein
MPDPGTLKWMAAAVLLLVLGYLVQVFLKS